MKKLEATMPDTRTALSWPQLQRQARVLLDVTHVPPRRYGTAFHIDSPVEDVREMKPRNRETRNGETLTAEELEKVMALMNGKPDPYLFWYLAHADRLPVRTIRLSAGQERDVVIEGSECVWVFLEAGAKVALRQDIVQEDAAVNRVFVWQAEDSECTYWGMRAQNLFLDERVQVMLEGRGAKAQVRHITFGRQKEQLNMEVQAYHRAPHTESNLLVRSAAADRHVAVYRGLIDIDEGAKGSKGYQSARTLLLSRGAVVDSLPELAIRTNDVQCSHGVNTTHLDEAALFYMRSRGLDRQQAAVLALTGFYHDKLDIPADLAKQLESLLYEFGY